MEAIRLTSDTGITDSELESSLKTVISGRTLRKVLLLPPDATRSHSKAGEITRLLYDMLNGRCHIDIMPALGTHEAMNEQECGSFLGVPFSSVISHNYRDDVVKLGEVPRSFIASVSGGMMDEPIDIEVNRRLLDESYDLIISIGQVVPHEVAGMANYSKNIFVGCGGSKMISSTHMLGAYYGLERIMGRADTPVRRVFDYAEEHFIAHLPLAYIMTVTTQAGAETVMNGLFIGRERSLFEEAARLSQCKNMTFVEKPLKKCVVYLDDEFKSTWVGNKAIYRTRMAMADDGELIILAPNVKRFGENGWTDALIRKYGFVGRRRILELVAANEDLRENLSAAAHLIHGSSDGKFTVTYAVSKLSRQEIESVGFNYMPLDEAMGLYDTATLNEGYNQLNGSEVFYINNPALGLWAVEY